ncbi:MAG: glutathione-independent formaldehyde dehydrogenase [Nitrosospira sp.]
MLALTYHGSHDVRVDTVPDPILQEPDDIILKVTATAICGSDLHLYRGKLPGLEDGDILGHEFMDIVADAGPEVTELQKGDRVVVPFVIACGQCFFCERQLYSACETTNPGRGAILNKKNVHSGAALFGYTRLHGGVPGGQAEYVRVPKANVGPIRIPDSLSDDQVLFLSDILPTGYQALVNTEIGPGASIAIFGAGPVGLMTAACARMLGVEKIFMVNHHPYRLDFARQTYGVIPINFDDTDPAEFIIDNTAFRGVDAAVDAIGFEAKGSALKVVTTNLETEGSSGCALRQCIAAVRRSILPYSHVPHGSIKNLFHPQTSGARDE